MAQPSNQGKVGLKTEHQGDPLHLYGENQLAQKVSFLFESEIFS